MELKLEKGYYVDNNNNKWNAKSYNENEALRHSKGLVNCNNCTNGFHVYDSKDCKFCSYVKNAKGREYQTFNIDNIVDFNDENVKNKDKLPKVTNYFWGGGSNK